MTAIQWAAASLKDAGDLLKESDSLPLASFNEANPDGKILLASAKQILANLGKNSDSISLADASDTSKIFAGTKFNGDGVIDTSEIRVQGWLLEKIVNRWRIDPEATLNTSH